MTRSGGVDIPGNVLPVSVRILHGVVSDTPASTDRSLPHEFWIEKALREAQVYNPESGDPA